jgi:hypothetical protein
MLAIAVFWRDGKEIVSPEKVVPWPTEIPAITACPREMANANEGLTQAIFCEGMQGYRTLAKRQPS